MPLRLPAARLLIGTGRNGSTAAMIERQTFAGGRQPYRQVARPLTRPHRLLALPARYGPSRTPL
jgi:hypothetical protein